jgi:hypothetical protein
MMCAHIALVHLYGKGPEIDGELVLPEEIEQGVTLYIRVLRPSVSEAGHARGA